MPSASVAGTANSAGAAANADKLDNVDSSDFARGEDSAPTVVPTLVTGAIGLQINSSSSRDFGRFRIEATGTQDQFRVCNEDNASRGFVVYTGGAPTSTDSARQQFDVATNSCSAGISAGNTKGDFQVFGLDAAVFAHSPFSSQYRYYAIKR